MPAFYIHERYAAEQEGPPKLLTAQLPRSIKTLAESSTCQQRGICEKIYFKMCHPGLLIPAISTRRKISLARNTEKHWIKYNKHGFSSMTSFKSPQGQGLKRKPKYRGDSVSHGETAGPWYSVTRGLGAGKGREPHACAC